jgi:hypothetical protein
MFIYNGNGIGIVHGSGPWDNYIPALTAIRGPVTIRTCLRIVQHKALFAGGGCANGSPGRRTLNPTELLLDGAARSFFRAATF